MARVGSDLVDCAGSCAHANWTVNGSGLQQFTSQIGTGFGTGNKRKLRATAITMWITGLTKHKFT